MNLTELKEKSISELMKLAEEMKLENLARTRKQDIIFAILNAHAESGEDIFGGGVLEILQDGFGFLRSADSSYLAGPDDIYVKSGNVYTSAGVTAGIDLTLSLVAEDLGHEISLQVAKNLVVYYHRPGGQKQFSHQLKAQLEAPPVFDRVLLYINANLHKELTVELLASVSNMSGRNFSRQFSSEMGATPAKYVEVMRIERMQQLLESSDLRLNKIADLTGFGSVDVMRRAFVRHLGVTPIDYRLNFSR